MVKINIHEYSVVKTVNKKQSQGFIETFQL